MYLDGFFRLVFIELCYELIGGLLFFNKGCFCGGWWWGYGEVDQVLIMVFNCGGGFVMFDFQDLEGQCIGFYLMNEIVVWVKQWLEVIVNLVMLLFGQGQGVNKECCNCFYEQFGLVFDYEDFGMCVVGILCLMFVVGFRLVEIWCVNIEEFDVWVFIVDLIWQNESLSYQFKWFCYEEWEVLECLDVVCWYFIFWMVCQLWDNMVVCLKF